MKVIRIAILALLVGSATITSVELGKTDQPVRNRVKVLTYNIYGGRNTDLKRDLDRIASVINELQPDIVALQEVDRHTGRLNGVDLAAELGRRTQMQHAFGRAMKYDGGEYGEAVLSRFPIVTVDNLGLPTMPLEEEDEDRQEVEPRAALTLKLRFPDSDQEFVFIGTHLDHLRDPANRNLQAAALKELPEAYQGIPAILAGDLNAQPDSEAIGTISEAWTDTWPSKGPQGTNSMRNRRIDYIFTAPTPEYRWRVMRTYRGIDVKTDDPAWEALLGLASDHLPVMAELELVNAR